MIVRAYRLAAHLLFWELSLLLPTGASAEPGTFCEIVNPSLYLSPSKITGIIKASHKSEYESSVAFESRLEAAVPKTIYASVSIEDTTDPVTQEIVASGLMRPAIQYDADARVLVVNREYAPIIGSDAIQTGDATNYGLVGIGSQFRTARSYIGQNVFGARVRVRETFDTEQSLAFKTSGPSFAPIHDVLISSTPAQAKSIRSRLRVLLVGEPAPPFVMTNNSFHAATVMSRTDSWEKYQAIVVTPICAALYDGRTRHIYESWAASSKAVTP